MKETFEEQKTESSDIQARLDDLRRIFKDYEINLREKTGVGKLTFKQIRKQMHGVWKEYQRLANSPEIDESKRGKYKVEAEEMDEILFEAEKTSKIEEEI